MDWEGSKANILDVEKHCLGREYKGWEWNKEGGRINRRKETKANMLANDTPSKIN